MENATRKFKDLQGRFRIGGNLAQLEVASFSGLSAAWEEQTEILTGLMHYAFRYCLCTLAALLYSPVDFTDASDLHQTVVKFIG